MNTGVPSGPGMVVLEPMTDEELRASIERSIPPYAEVSVRRGTWTAEAALATARAEFDELVPRGIDTPGRHFAHVRERPGGPRVGEVWYRITEKGGKTQAWVDWIWIAKEFRRRGLGRAVLELVGREAALRGADRIGLNVEADNPEAMEFYRRLGFEATSSHLARRIPPPTGDGPD